MEFIVDGQLKEWLEQDGRHDLVDAGTVEADPEEIKRLEQECCRLHPFYSPEMMHAWALFSIVTRRKIPKSEQDMIGKDASAGVARVAAAAEGTAREFRALKGAFDQQHEKIGDVAGAVNTLTAQVQAESLSIQTRLGGLALGVHGDIQHMQEWLAATIQVILDDGKRDRSRAEAERKRRSVWLWVWRIAVLLALLGFSVLRAYGAPEPANAVQPADVLRGLLLRPPVWAQGGGGFVTSNSHTYFFNGTNWVPAASGTPFPITCVSGCVAGGSFSDNAAFTVGSTSISPIGAYYTSGAAPTLSTGNAGRVRMDSNSYLFVDCVTGCAGGATTPADGFTTPTTAGVGMSFNAGYNGSTWDLLRSGDKNNVTGVTGVLNTGPLGRYNATQPTLTDTRYNMLQLSARGELFVSPGVSGFPITFSSPQHNIVDSGTVTANISGSISNTSFAATQGTSPWVISFTAPQHAIIDSGTITTITNPVAVTLATAPTTHVIVDSGNLTSNQNVAVVGNAAVTNAGTFATQSAITAASASIASGAFASGSIASGAVASGAIASGACAAGCIADGGDTTEGAKTDTASTATDGTGASVVSILKEISKMEQTPAALAAGTNVIGHVITDAGSVVTATLSAETTKVIGTVNQGTSPWVSTVSGPDAVAVAPTKNPLQVGGVDNTSNCSAGPCVQNAVFANGSLKGNEFGLITRDEADQVIVNQLTALLAAQQNVRIRGTFGRTISSTNDAIDVNVKSQTMSQDPCQLRKSDVAISQTATTLLVAGSGGNFVWVCYARLVAGAAEIPSFIEGTGATCGTGTLAVSGSTTAANGESYAANGGFSGGSGSGTIMATKVAGNSLCLQQSGSNRIAGNIAFVVSP